MYKLNNDNSIVDNIRCGSPLWKIGRQNIFIDSGLILACIYNKNLEAIKYFIDGCRKNYGDNFYSVNEELLATAICENFYEAIEILY